ncbi:hypothetical protein TSTA_084900 [Talaromyces stipitatus ATCC 10500]|uniref:DUF659 domain-containing protein n=1 Tax=Talaromyces stipitatus (strain ATCC 10500 / CBS 375.48 / QM 6759 / NRRL 1006) TaxID=441959 RepID=B8M0G2_TALSN|nr:uncharacterized protein TSTA_084900 [Talaromyces stipitatus ATCC 10500]EED21259.1 hypothetical protein TSTA_084900 [Talaromyces stipitatus ATCC 10500]
MYALYTSKNNLPILAMIGHWLTEDFFYKERVLEFIELHGIHSSENIAIAIQTTLSQLNLGEKLITITGDNASNNETMASELFHLLNSDWERSSQIHRTLTKFNELTLFVSKRKSQISLAIPVYYELHDLLCEGSESQWSFKELDPDIASALKEGLKKYMKYYTFMNESEIY